jgi:hypothetical protein
MLLAGVAGVLWSFVARRREACILFAFPLAFYLSAGRGYTVFVRYMVPVVPFLCLGAAVFLERVVSALGIQRLRSQVLILLAVCLGLPSLHSSWCFDSLLLQPDNRAIVTEWLAANSPDGSTVMGLGPIWGNPELPESLVAHRAGQGMADFVIVQRHPIPYNYDDGRHDEMLAQHYAESAAFPTLDENVSVNAFDPVDAFYVPYSPLTGVSRPGPELYVYKLKK